jgi:hypothetical protein
MAADSAPTSPPGYRTQAADTTVDVERLLIDAYRRMPSWEKARRLGEMTNALDVLALVGIDARHPGAADHERRLRLAALRLDRETMMNAFGWDPLVHGY